MPRTCTVCRHPDRASVDRALVQRRPFRDIAHQFGVSKDAAVRHHDEHLPAALAEARRAADVAAAIDVMAEARRCFERVNLLFAACDRWLRNADDPSRYDIGPRAAELLVTYEQADPDTGRTKARKEPLSRLLARVEGGLSVGVVLVETKHADPRDLVLKAVDRLHAHSELFVKIVQAQEMEDRVKALEEQLGDAKPTAGKGGRQWGI